MKKLATAVILAIFLGISQIQAEEGGINTLTLAAAVKLALENNPGLQASEASVAVMEAKFRSAKSVLYPQIEFRFILPFIERESGIFADQLIWDFWRTPSLIKAAKSLVESSEFDLSATEKDLILNTKIAYYTALSGRGLAHSAEQSLAQREARLEQAEAFFRAGRVSRIELTRAKVDVANAKLALINARNNLDLGKSRLATLMGYKGEFNFDLVDMLEYKKAEINLENAIAAALVSRPELKSLMAKEVGIKADLLASKNNLYFPQVLGRAAYRFDGDGATGPDFIAGVGVRFPLFTGFSHLAGVGEARAKLRRIEAEIEAAKGDIALEIKRLYLDLKSAEEALSVMELTKASADETLQLAEERDRLGRASKPELAEANALSAEVSANLSHAIYNYKIAVSRLERATGEDIGE